MHTLEVVIPKVKGTESQLDRFFETCVGGFTKYEAYGKGQGYPYEQSNVYILSAEFDVLIRTLTTLRAVLGNKSFDQKALYFRFNGVASIVDLEPNKIVKYTV